MENKPTNEKDQKADGKGLQKKIQLRTEQWVILASYIEVFLIGKLVVFNNSLLNFFLESAQIDCFIFHRLNYIHHIEYLFGSHFIIFFLELIQPKIINNIEKTFKFVESQKG